MFRLQTWVCQTEKNVLDKEHTESVDAHFLLGFEDGTTLWRWHLG